MPRRLLVLLALVFTSSQLAVALGADEPKPWNILWLSCEDTSPDLGCYGDTYAATPTLDALAASGARYTRCFSHAPVCAPSRSGLITGVYPTTLGTHNMRSRVEPPANVHCFPAYLREAGYYCTNNSKTDYNFAVPKDAWNENSAKAHFRNRPDKSQPFFAVFNFTVSHESQARANEVAYQKNTSRLLPGQRHDPAKAILPSYYPDTPLVRSNWARCYDNVTAVDYLVGDMLKQLEEDGLADRTVVFFFGDHGRGLTRGKRWLYDSGLHVPLLVRWPGQIAPQTVVDDLTAFIDFAPTVLSLANIPAPPHMQGRAFLGPHKLPPREYIYAARDRMDERYDMFRAVRDKRYKYIRNFEPWKPYAQHVSYGEQMPILQEIRRLAAADKLTGPPALFLRPTKPVEELYDTDNDRDEVRNLAGDPKYAEVLARLRSEQQRWSAETHDLGLLPEPLMYERIAARPDDWREVIKREGLLERLRKIESLSRGGESERTLLTSQTGEAEPAVRATALKALRQLPNSAQHTALYRKLLQDLSPIVRVIAAESLVQIGETGEALPVLERELKSKEFAVALNAALVLDQLGKQAAPVTAALREANSAKGENDYVVRVSAHALQQLGIEPARLENK